jgi:nanoRNase/pAp phosphatase (c-di-AMP/oligoRNAs hydrolase)
MCVVSFSASTLCAGSFAAAAFGRGGDGHPGAAGAAARLLALQQQQ